MGSLKKLVGKFLVGDGCWEWTAAVDGKGYGAVYLEGRKQLRAHRAVYEALVGPIPAGLVLDHLCRNKRCVRPDHLEPVTMLENTRRARPTHCLRGHPLSGDNLITEADGRRKCRACKRLRRGYTGLGIGSAQRARTHCPQGHPYDDANTYVAPKTGWRQCRACHSARKVG